MAGPNGVVVWEGPSRLDGSSPVVVIITGLAVPTSNPKTGDMLQAWILLRDEAPVKAIRSGADSAICGDCPRRGSACYVNPMGPQSIWRSYRDGGYPRVDLRRACELVSGWPLRIGAYGDPAAVPVNVWRKLAGAASSRTGYTHQWRRFPSLRGLVMASADSPADAVQAQAKGWRTFRVRSVAPAGAEPLLAGEVVCPSSDEAGRITWPRTRKTTCEHCRLCRGAGEARSVAIIDHSATARAIRRRLDVVA